MKYTPPHTLIALLKGDVNCTKIFQDQASDEQMESLIASIDYAQQWARLAPVVDISNVVRYYFSVTDPRARPTLEDGIPIVAPPVEVLWLETAMDPSWVKVVGNTHLTPASLNLGNLILADRIGAGAAMHVTMMTFQLSHRGNAIPQSLLDYNTDESGAFRGDGTSRVIDTTGTVNAGLTQWNDFNPFPFLLAISFMHCKNVHRTSIEPNRTHRKLAEREHRKAITYDVLEIGAMGQTLQTEGSIETHGLPKALHICRGHFATYSTEKPLFGKFTGRFWKPMHTRGRLDRGIAIRDYAVTAPRAE